MNNLIKTKLKITGMHCTSCAMNIDGELEDTDGVKESNTSYTKQITEVTFDPDEITTEQMISIIKKLDDKYDAEVIKPDK